MSKETVNIIENKILLPLLVGVAVFLRLIPPAITDAAMIEMISLPLNLLIVIAAGISFLKHPEVDSFTLSFLGFLFLQFIASIINGTSFFSAFWSFILHFSYLKLLQDGLKKSTDACTVITLLLFIFLLLINVSYMLENPLGKYMDYNGQLMHFLGNRNAIMVYGACALVTGYSFLYSEHKAFAIILWVTVWAVLGYTYYLSHSITSIMGLLFLLVYSLFLNRSKTRSLFNINTYILFGILFFMFVVFCQYQGNFTDKFLALTEKSSTFSGRTKIWRDYMTAISKHPVFGYGILDSNGIRNVFGNTFTGRMPHAHNIFLNVTFQMGLIGLLCFFILLAETIKAIRFIKNKRIRYFYEALAGALLLMSQFEAYSYEMYYFVFIYMVSYAQSRGEEKMNSICWPSVKEMIKRHWVVWAIYLCGIVAFAGFFGYKKMGVGNQVSEEYLAAVEEFDAAVAEYDASIADVEATIKQQTDAVQAKQDYVDNSVYMRLNPDEVYVGSLQYTLTVAEGVNIGSVGNALVSYCRDGGLIEDAEKMSDSPDIKYWQEVITLQLNANTNFNVAIMTVDEDAAKEANDIIRKCISRYLPAVRDDFGEFKLELMNESVFTKSEAAVVNNQNSHRNDLRSNINTRVDLENKLITTKNNKASFIENNQPVSDAVSPKTAFVKNFAIIMILGIGALVALFWFILTFDNIVRGIADLEQLGLSILGKYQKKKGFKPEADRIAMDVALIAGKNGSSSVYIANIGNEAECAEAVTGLSEAVAKKELTVLSGFDPIDKADALTDMLSAGQCVLVVRCGLTKTAKVKEFCDVCKKYGIAVMGTVAVM